MSGRAEARTLLPFAVFVFTAEHTAKMIAIRLLWPREKHWSAGGLRNR